MVAVRVTRLTGEVNAESPVSIGLTGQALEILAQPTGTVPCRVTRITGEVTIKVPPKIVLTRQTLELMAQPTAPVPVRVTRFSGEVCIDNPTFIVLTKQTLEILSVATGVTPIRVTRITGEFAVRPPPSVPIPIDLPEGLAWWLHNWVAVPTLTTAFLTDVATSPETLSEGRRGLRTKPVRTATVLVGPVEGKVEVDKLIKYCKRFQREQMVMPIFADAKQTTADVEASDNFLPIDTTTGRFFVGARVVVFTLDNFNEIATAQTYTILTVTSTEITTTALLGFDFPETRTVVIPLIDVKMRQGTRITFPLSGQVAMAEIEVEEIGGDPALPPLGIGDIWFHSDDRAIWPFDHNWAEDLEVEYRREGEAGTAGRDSYFVPSGDRERMVHSYRFVGERAEFFELIRFFEAHRGRLVSFWHNDVECLWTPVNYRTGGNAFLFDLSPLNEFDDFEAKVNETNHIGIVFSDGRRIVREVVSMTEGATWQITVAESLPTGYLYTDIVHVSVSRKSRFDSDAFTEEWDCWVAGAATPEVVEVLKEEDHEL